MAADYCPECKRILLWVDGKKVCAIKTCSKYGKVVK
jgi:uncharacterized Zn finger protein (UPF0148 family)